MSTYEDNSLYMMIRDRAGSKMLRQAEQINTFNHVNSLFNDKASILINNVWKLYPVLDEETPMSFITFSEVSRIKEKELEGLPWIYVDMLRVLTWQDKFSSRLVNEMIDKSPAAAWRIPLAPGVDNKDAFEYTYSRWYEENRNLVRSASEWAREYTCDETCDETCEC